MRIQYDELRSRFEEILLGRGAEADIARAAAKNFADSSLDGVYSHGVNKFSMLIDYIDKGVVDPKARPECVERFGSMERWNGNMGLGNVNAGLAMERACEIAKQSGVGLVAIGNNNHWMRGGAFGWQAADNGCIGICWTNTCPNTPAWGGMEAKIGNNPFVMSIPRADGHHIVFDCAMSQFAYGKVDMARMKGEKLPIPGGFDTRGELTTDPNEILASNRMLTIGYWKGSAFSIVLDLIAAILSNGNTVTDIGQKYTDEVGLSQILIAIDPTRMTAQNIAEEMIQRVMDDIKSSTPAKPGDKIRYPGERDIAVRAENREKGIPVLDEVWEKIEKL